MKVERLEIRQREQETKLRDKIKRTIEDEVRRQQASTAEFTFDDHEAIACLDFDRIAGRVVEAVSVQA